MSTHLPIEEHGIIGDLRTVALVGTDGTIDWYCPARFDAPHCSPGCSTPSAAAPSDVPAAPPP